MEKGTCFEFGRWPYDIAGPPIALEWIVIETKSNGSIVAISSRIIETLPFSTDPKRSSWAVCDLRKWLNLSFFKWAFNSQERSLLKSINLENTGNVKFHIPDRENTDDRIFVLSASEAQSWNIPDTYRQDFVSPYAISRGSRDDWWLRSPGFTDKYASIIHSVKWIREGGCFVSDASLGVRPCIVLDYNFQQEHLASSLGDEILSGSFLYRSAAEAICFGDTKTAEQLLAKEQYPSVAGALSFGYVSEQAALDLLNRGLIRYSMDLLQEAIRTHSYHVGLACIRNGIHLNTNFSKPHKTLDEVTLALMSADDPQSALSHWNEVSVSHLAVSTMIDSLNLDTIADKSDLLAKVASKGYIDLLNRLKNASGYLTLQNIPFAVTVASNHEEFETAAFLIDLKDHLEQQPDMFPSKPSSLIKREATMLENNRTKDALNLSFEIINLAKTTLLSNYSFLSLGIARLTLTPTTAINTQLAIDETHLYFNPYMLIKAFNASKGEPPIKELLHAVLHCALLHPYHLQGKNIRLWGIACDIIVERAVRECCGDRPGQKGAAINDTLRVLLVNLDGKLSTTILYEKMRAGKWGSKINHWESLFVSDDHRTWLETHSDCTPTKSIVMSSFNTDEQSNTPNDKQDNHQDALRNDSEFTLAEAALSLAVSDGDAPSMLGTSEESNLEGSTVSTVYNVSHNNAGAMHIITNPTEEENWSEWKHLASILAVNLQTFAKRRGRPLDSLISDLQIVSRDRIDYTTFLRQFASRGETIHLSDDEFDYVFYSYGLRQYGNIPLIEPVEYREDSKIKEFVIVIDTSGSVQGSVVRRFIATTYGILKSTESFHQCVHIRIIQCDDRVRTDDVITSLDELQNWSESMEIVGCGGTDFQPAFEYVDKLVEKNTFSNLGGLIYFTDGLGKYPDWLPSYKVAFCYYGETTINNSAPPWAIQVVVDEASLEISSSTIQKERI